MANLVILEEDGEMVRVVAQHGLPASFAPGARFPAAGSATLATIERGQPLVVEDTLAQTEFPVAFEGSQKGGFRSFLAVPLPLEAPRAVIGVCSSEPHRFAAEEVAYLEGIAHQAAVAIRNAQLYEREHRMLAELARLAEQLRAQNEALERALADHAKLTRLVLEERGLGSIARTLAGLLGNPVLIEDHHFQVLAWARPEGTAGEAAPGSLTLGYLAARGRADPELRRSLDGLARQRHTARFPAQPRLGIHHPRVVAPVLAGRDRFAYLSVVEESRTLTPVDLMTVESGAMVCALELLKQKAAFEVELRLKADFFTDLLAGSHSNEEAVFSRAAFLGFDFSRPSSLLLVNLDDFESFAAGREAQALRVKRDL
jgi:hypothetical protein